MASRLNGACLLYLFGGSLFILMRVSCVFSLEMFLVLRPEQWSAGESQGRSAGGAPAETHGPRDRGQWATAAVQQFISMFVIYLLVLVSHI